MLTSEDIKNLIDYQKEVFANKENLDKLDFEIASIRERMAARKDIDSMSIKMNDLILLVDNYSKKAELYFQEIVRMNQGI